MLTSCTIGCGYTMGYTMGYNGTASGTLPHAESPTGGNTLTSCFYTLHTVSQIVSMFWNTFDI